MFLIVKNNCSLKTRVNTLIVGIIFLNILIKLFFRLIKSKLVRISILHVITSQK